MDIIEANECLRHSFGAPKKGSFDDKSIGEAEGEPQPSLEEQRASREADATAHSEQAQRADEEGEGDWQALEEDLATIEGEEEVDEVVEEAEERDEIEVDEAVKSSDD